MIFNKPYALTQDYLNMMKSKYDSFTAEDMQKFCSQMSPGKHFEKMMADADKDASLKIVNGVAVIDVIGVLEKRTSELAFFFGGTTSTEVVKAKINRAMAMEKVQRIILNIDSPGGEVDGVLDLSESIFNSSQKKPITAFINELAASGAYWIASACTQRILNGRNGSSTAKCGSVGVVALHQDISKMEEMHGVKTTEVVSTFSPFKRVTSAHTPLSQEGAEELQRKVNELYFIMTENIGKYLGISQDSVTRNFGDGRVYIGKDCINRGMASQIDTLDAVLERQSINSGKFLSNGGKPMQFNVSEITHEFLAKHAPNIVASIEQKAVAKLEINKEYLAKNHSETLKAIEKDSYNAGFAKGCNTERERIKEIEDITPDGFEAVAEKYKFDGKTSAGDVATAILKEQKHNRNTSSSALENESASMNEVKNVAPKENAKSEEELNKILSHVQNTVVKTSSDNGHWIKG